MMKSKCCGAELKLCPQTYNTKRMDCSKCGRHQHEDIDDTQAESKAVPIRYIPLLERLTNSDRRDLAQWVRSKKPDVYVEDDAFASVRDYEQALLADLEDNQGSEGELPRPEKRKHMSTEEFIALVNRITEGSEGEG